MDNSVVLVTGGNGDIGHGVVKKILDRTNNSILITVTPKNKGKFLSKRKPVYRSMWERRFMIYCDRSENILEWDSDASDISSVEKAMSKMRLYQITHFIQVHGSSNINDRLDLQNYQSLIYHNNINIFSTIIIIQLLLQGMKEREFGRICLMGTASSDHGGGFESFGYGMAKHSMDYLIKHLAKYYTSFNILSNCISPGFIDTKFHSSVMKRSPNQIQERAKMVKLNRAGSSEEVADLAFFARSWI